MKLIYYIIIQLSIVLSAVLTIWAVFFYMTIIAEINDETDDSLEDFAEQIIMRKLAGEAISTEQNNSNNQYYLRELTVEQAHKRPHIRYQDSMIYIPSKKETEPARILTNIFIDNNGQYHELLVAIPTIEKNDLKESILYWMIILYITLLLCILLINVWIYHRSNRPLYRLLTWLNTYKIGEENATLNNETAITEYLKLNEAVLGSMQRSEEVFEEQKQFLGNASHEIQTPLAVCRNRLENLMEDETLTETQLDELSKTLLTLEQITRLNKTLLLLSKIENKQFTEISLVNLNEVFKKNICDYQEVYAHLNIDVEIIETGTFQVVMNEMLEVILVNNLLKNAFAHNIESGKIVIQLSTSKISVNNNGQPLALDQQHLFKRFYQANKKPESSGLGLSLIKSICDLSGLQISYSFALNLHCFELKKQ